MPPALPNVLSDSRFGYFLLQTHIANGEEAGPAVISLIVEDLSTGEKRAFASIGEFSRFLGRLAEPAGDERWAPPTDA